MTDVAAMYDEFASAIRAGDHRACIDLAAHMPASLRKPLSEELRRRSLELLQDHGSAPPESVARAYQFAIAGVEPAARTAAGHLRFVSVRADEPSGAVDATVDLVAVRTRGWLSQFADALLAQQSAHSWRVAHALVCRGLAERPARPEYVVGVLWATRPSDLPDASRRDPQLATLVSEMLRTPGVAHQVLSWEEQLEWVRDQHAAPARRSEAAVELKEGWRGLVDVLSACEGRDGAIDACLAGLSGGLPDSDAPGLAAIHDHLELTVPEIVRRQERYARLLVVDAAAAYRTGLVTLRAILAAGDLDGGALLDVSPNVLVRREKTRVRDHLRLLRDAVAAGAVDASGAARIVANSLDGDRTDLAVEAARLLAGWGGALDPDAVAELRGLVSSAVPEPWPALRRALGVLAADDEADSRPGRTASASYGAATAPVDLPGPGRVEPVADCEELLVLLEEVLTQRPTAMDVERALDGMNRFREPAAVARSGRVDRMLSAVALSNLTDDVIDVVRAWCGVRTPPLRPGDVRIGTVTSRDDVPPDASVIETGTRAITTWVPSEQGSPGSVVDPFSGGHEHLATVHHPYVVWRRHEPAWHPRHLVYRRLARLRLAHFEAAPAPLLALPTSEDGTVSAEAVIERLHRRAAAGLGTEPHDLGTALLRIQPADRDALLASGHLRPETAERVSLVGRTPAWVRGVTTRATTFDGLSNVSHGWAPVGVWLDRNAPHGSPDDPVRGWLDTSSLEDRWSDYPANLDARVFPHFVSLWALAVPSHVDILAAHLQRTMLSPLADHREAAPDAVRALGLSRGRWGAPAATVLLLAASAEDVGMRTVAAEVLAEVTRRGQLVGSVLGEALVTVVGPNAGPWGDRVAAHPKLTRVAGVLADATRIDDMAARTVLDGVVPTLGLMHAQAGGYEIVALAAAAAERLRLRVEVPAEIAALAAGRSSSRTAAEARRLVAAGG